MADPSEPSGAGDARELTPSRRAAVASRWRWVGTSLSVLLFVASIVVLYQIVSTVKFADVRAAFDRKPLETLALAWLLTMTSYMLLTGYDALALRQVKAKIPYRTTALASFTSYAISFTLGFPLLTAGAVRYWIYSPRGLPAGKVAALTVIAGSTFLLGMGAVVGAGLLFRADAISQLNRLAPTLNQVIGAGVLGLIGAYLVYAALGRRHLKVLGRRLELPSFPVSVGQILLGIGDVTCAAGVLYVLLPEGYGVAFPTFAAVYAFACLLGIISHAPGGLGVFEATILLAFWRLPYEGMIGALLLFRICYYILPFCIALAVLAGVEIRTRLRAFQSRVAREEDSED
ncbi:lysylphosphatidylglycerol synthase domain-containing protein [uncultured Alsobacter sp.]|uniref:lysylphosphatidylglycerol synthase domain-containing protein n=1 Tax=uncultured Alsobacter sp. TaxID=1748258 RepID=UPI0025FA99AC|nr:lysylphosphatidylglycerol synthase domain-containing protein [uncultured Alsobacter sp.]